MKALSLSVYHWLASRPAAIGRFFDRMFAHREAALVVITCLCIILFAYSGAIKLAEYSTFVVRIGQSPMLAPYAGFIGWFIPVFELVIAAGLIASIFVARIQAPAHYLFFGAMVLFCFYIIGIFTISPDVPCACGGVIGEMGGWWGHLAFNLAFVGLSRKAIRLAGHFTPLPPKAASLLWRGSIALPFGIVLVLGLMVDPEPNHRHAGFERDFASTVPLRASRSLQLGYTGHYIAGMDGDKVYIGHHMIADRAIVLDISTMDTVHRVIDISRTDRNPLQLKVEGSSFYLLDGAGMRTYRGSVVDWRATRYVDSAWYTSAVPLSDGQLALFTMADQRNVLAKKRHGRSAADLYPQLLTAQGGDGIFSTDGKLLYDNAEQRVLFVYNYRNEYLVTDTAMTFVCRDNTVDTISQSRLKVGQLKSGNTYVLQEKLLVNIYATASQGKLYVSSNMLSQSENARTFRRNTAVDVYDYGNGQYRHSFYLPRQAKQKVRDYRVSENGLLVAMYGKAIYIYDMVKDGITQAAPSGHASNKDTNAQWDRKKEAEHLFKKK